MPDHHSLLRPSTWTLTSEPSSGVLSTTTQLRPPVSKVVPTFSSHSGLPASLVGGFQSRGPLKRDRSMTGGGALFFPILGIRLAPLRLWRCARLPMPPSRHGG